MRVVLEPAPWEHIAYREQDAGLAAALASEGHAVTYEPPIEQRGGVPPETVVHAYDIAIRIAEFVSATDALRQLTLYIQRASTWAQSHWTS